MFKRLLLLSFVLALGTQCIAQPFYSPAFFYENGKQALIKGNFPQAIADFNKAIALNPRFDSAYAAVGSAYMRVNKPDSGILCLIKATNINPRFTEAYTAIGGFYRDVQPNYPEALRNYHIVLQLDSTKKETLYSIAWCHNAQMQYDSAIKYAAMALNLDNTYRQAYSELAHAYRNSQKYAEAIEQFKKNLAVSVVDLPMFYIGLCQIELKQKDAVNETYQELLKVNDKLAASLKKRMDMAKIYMDE